MTIPKFPVYVRLSWYVVLKRKIWNAGILLWWYRLWIREDEFHKSLNHDFMATSVMNTEQKEFYSTDLIRRRNIIHRRTL